ncbi:Metal-sensitive transcriptional repressor, partial [Roseivivax halotolerans]
MIWYRVFADGRLSDAGRLPRYVAVFARGASALWAPILGYLGTATLKFTSSASLILPGSGASASVNLSEIGQASSFANSAFSNGLVKQHTLDRLSRLEGQVRGVARMVESDRYCMDILAQ